MERNDGGAAFPVSYGPDGRPGYSGGMTLRDYFAGQALAGMLAYPGDEQSGSFHNNCTLHDAARLAYEYADAMLAAREEVSNG